jgi:hypothetical protein
MRVIACTAAIGLALMSLGFTRGSFTVNVKTWDEAYARIPCTHISKDGSDLKIAGLSVTVDNQSQPMPIIVTKQDDIEHIEKRCKLKR